MGSRFTLILFLAAALFAAQGSAEVAAPVWDQFHYDAAHTGFNRQERALTRSNVQKLRRAWSVKTGGAVEGSVAVTPALVFVGSDDNMLRAYHLDGSEAWSTRLP